jgi:zinc/manganese transport system permease protein
LTIHHLLSALFEPGIFSSQPVQLAAVLGGVVALASGTVGVFTVIRGQAFAGHALGDIGTTGGSGAFLIGVNPLWGFVGMGIAAAGVMELLGVRRARGRDVATGVVLGAALGLAALFLYWDTTFQNTTGATMTILFGSIFTIEPATEPAILLFALLSVGIVLALYRPLLLSSVSPEMAAARGVSVRAVGLLYLLGLAVAVSLSAITIGTILSTALLIGPAATAMHLTKVPSLAIVEAGLLGLAATWLGILLAYDSYYWPPFGHGWPVSFFVVTLIFAFYLIARSPLFRRLTGRRPAPAAVR